MSMGSDTSVTTPAADFGWKDPNAGRGPYTGSGGGDSGPYADPSNEGDPRTPPPDRIGDAQRRRALLMQQAMQAFHQIHSAARPELAGFLNPNLNANDISHVVPYIHSLIQQARQGTFNPNAHLGAAANTALLGVENDFSGVRDARARLRAARTSGGDVVSARRGLGAERRFAMAGEHRQMSQAELAQKNPELYDRLYGRATKFRIG